MSPSLKFAIKEKKKVAGTSYLLQTTQVQWVPLTMSKKDAKETARYKGVLIVIDFFNIEVNYFDTKKSAHYSRLLVVTELVACGTQVHLSVSKTSNISLHWSIFGSILAKFSVFSISGKIDIEIP